MCSCAASIEINIVRATLSTPEKADHQNEHGNWHQSWPISLLMMLPASGVTHQGAGQENGGHRIEDPGLSFKVESLKAPIQGLKV